MPEISSFSYKVIYVYTIPDTAHQGMMKIGQTEVKAKSGAVLAPDCEELRKAAVNRINEQTGTAAIKYDLRYVELAHFTADDGTMLNITDKEVHNVLKNSNYQQVTFTGLSVTPTEWFYVDDIEIVKKAIEKAKNDKPALDLADHKKLSTDHPVIKFRDEQSRAITQTTNRFKIGNKMLWNAKMRFGKTLCALEVIKRMGYRRTIIITHRPTVRSGWFDDFNLLGFDDSYFFGQRRVRLPKPSDDDTPEQKELYKLMAAKVRKHNVLEDGARDSKMNYIYFASIQDLRGSQRVGGNHDKNNDIFDTPWDLMIIDEAHEGTVTELGDAVIKELQKRPELKTLYLSGTPYNIMSNFEDSEVFTWDYVMEQQAKADWPLHHPDEPNPYERLPKMMMHRYSLSDKFPGYGFDEENDYFNFTEFFRCDPDTHAFVHEADVKRFIQLLCREDVDTGYPYSTEEYRYALSHTLWVLPSVDAANEMERLLQLPDSPLREYFVINVAGDNVNNAESPDAPQKVQNGIAKHPRTITLTINSGRMTVGVSVPEWSGVFMLSGAAKAKAAGYLQTIFRAQTPTKSGVYPFKTICHAFDFAPDRTLEIVNEVADLHAKASKKSGQKTSMSHHQAVEQTLHFLPIIAHDMSCEEPLDTNEFMKMVDHSYSEHIARRGFADRRLFVDLDSLSPEQYRIIGNLGIKMRNANHQFSNASASGAAVDLAKNGLDEKGKKKQTSATGNSGSNGSTKPTPPSSKKSKDSPGTQALRILREIYTRLPMMIFGCDIPHDAISLQRLIDTVDDESWSVFMPKGITKNDMQQLIDMKIVQESRFVSAALLVRDETRAADSLPVTERVKVIANQIARFRFPDKETVLTPWRVVNMHMANTIGGWSFYNDDFTDEIVTPRFVDQGAVTTTVFNPDSQILEINSKSGLYPLYVTYSLFRWRKEHPKMFDPDDDKQLWQQIVAENVYVLCMSEMAAKITKRVLLGYSEGTTHVRAYLKNRDLITDIKTQPAEVVKRLRGSQNFWNNSINNMDFNALVGNPPYQIMDGGGTGSSSQPIYHKFVELARLQCPKYTSLIMPSRWMTGGKGLDAFRELMLKDNHIRVLHDHLLASDCFPNVAIEGGICYYLWDKENPGLCQFTTHSTNGSKTIDRMLSEGDSDVVIRDSRAIDILNKVKKNTKNYFSDIVSYRNPFGLNNDNDSITETPSMLKVFGRFDGNRAIKYLSNDFVFDKNSIFKDKWKVFMSKADGAAGQLGSPIPARIIGKAELGDPDTICTETFLAIGPFDTKDEAENTIKYSMTKFFRFMVGIRKLKNMTRDTYSFVPMQDFTSQSDIDWSKSVEEIDKKLYEIYGLTPDEVKFIETMIKPM